MRGNNQMMISNNLANMFTSEVIKWRQYAAKLWSLIIIFILVLAHNLTSTIEYKSIVQVIIDSISSIFTFHFCSSTLIILAIYWILFTFYDKQYKVTPKVFPNNIEKYLQILSPINSTYLMTSLVTTFIIATLLLSYYNWNNDILSYKSLFVILFSCFTNLTINLRTIINQRYLLNWPIVKQSKYFRFKSIFYSTAISLVKDLITHFIFYFIVFTFLRFFISFDGSKAMEMVYNIGNSIICIKIAFIINISHLISWYLYEIYLTESYHFDVQSKDPTKLSLHNALSLDSHPYIQLLALIDFVDISINSKSKRAQLFSLDYATRKPLNWNKVCNETLSILNKFMDIFSFDDMLHSTSFDTLVTSPYRSSLQRPKLDRYTKKQTRSTFSPLVEWLKTSKFYNENQNYKIQQLFLDSLIVIETLKSLSNMVMLSYKEDEYGIVQSTLPDILTTFVQLQKVIEKFAPLGMNQLQISFKLMQKTDANYVDLLIQKLILTVNESIYKITHTFGNSLKSLSLDENVEKRLQKYYLTQ